VINEKGREKLVIDFMIDDTRYPSEGKSEVKQSQRETKTK